MKKELLRIYNLSTVGREKEQLTGVSFCLFEGECIGLIGLSKSGKNTLIEILKGKDKRYLGRCYLHHEKVHDFEAMQEELYLINNRNYIIGDWSVAEYLGLLEEKTIFGVYNKKNMVRRVQEILKEYQIHLDAKSEIRKLSELDKRILDLVKACYKKKKIVIIEDEFEGCSESDILNFRVVMEKFKSYGISFILNSNSNMVSTLLPDKLLILRKSYLVKKYNQNYINGMEELESFMLGTNASNRKKHLDAQQKIINGHNEISVEVNRMRLYTGEEFKFRFQKGKIYSILTLDIRKKRELFEYLSGRKENRDMVIWVDGKYKNFKSLFDFLDCRIVASANLGDQSELMPKMSVGENLLIPSIWKLSTLQYMFSSKGIHRMLEHEFADNPRMIQDNMDALDTNDLIRLILERWLIYKPKVLILLEPFYNCDIYGVSLVKSYIKKFASIGTSVIIVKSREEYIEEISDEIIRI